MHRASIGLLLVALLAVMMPVADAAPGPIPDPVVVTFASADGSTFRSVLTQAADITAVEAALTGDGYAGIPNGALAYGDGGINAPHGWHMEETTLADVTIELCDGTASMVDADLTYWVKTVGRFCPWTATVLAVEPVTPLDPYEQCMSDGGVVSGLDQTCTLTTQTSHQNPAGRSGKAFRVTTQTTNTYSPGNTTPATKTETLSCQNPAGQYLGKDALEHNPHCQ